MRIENFQMGASSFAMLSLTLFIGNIAFADGLSTGLPADELGRIHESLNEIEHSASEFSGGEAFDLSQGLDLVIRHAKDVQKMLQNSGGIVLGRWIQTKGQPCIHVCRSSSMTVARSPDGAVCASGEVRPLSAQLMGISYVNGIWPRNGQSEEHVVSDSVGTFCYKPGQKRDNDRTDVTMGCYCQ